MTNKEDVQKIVGDNDIMKEVMKKIEDYNKDGEIIGLHDYDFHLKELAKIEARSYINEHMVEVEEKRAEVEEKRAEVEEKYAELKSKEEQLDKQEEQFEKQKKQFEKQKEQLETQFVQLENKKKR